MSRQENIENLVENRTNISKENFKEWMETRERTSGIETREEKAKRKRVRYLKHRVAYLGQHKGSNIISSSLITICLEIGIGIKKDRREFIFWSTIIN